ncbi:hypothetical protein [Candidatus Phytoplasma palmae]|uniref:hypothetical protein n=1 Tax=Candidatus Phytoplasma palmae TaxID=85624 RepID=UPI0039909F74
MLNKKISQLFIFLFLIILIITFITFLFFNSSQNVNEFADNNEEVSASFQDKLHEVDSTQKETSFDIINQNSLNKKDIKNNRDIMRLFDLSSSEEVKSQDQEVKSQDQEVKKDDYFHKTVENTFETVENTSQYENYKVEMLIDLFALRLRSGQITLQELSKKVNIPELKGENIQGKNVEEVITILTENIRQNSSK